MFKNNFNVDKDWGNEQLHFLNKSLVNLPEVFKFLAYIYFFLNIDYGLYDYALYIKEIVYIWE